ncbi:LacI family transcriptional regulator [Clavibacter sepedonicus]|uniref:LacI-family transcriptional regulator n=3 Tax=Microbacteriaceae TaxID=85023 RepID=B0RCN1_CLASE|nr:LacI family transcriptional regulator [Clavibacter sepedonicus]OQJ53022.1 LacI family transcriptional regulator [Clavibacter sepedonicus]CAQ01799.1 putative LacI-family transcriptional regulator [Clavibacter sepedonicus]
MSKVGVRRMGRAPGMVDVAQIAGVSHVTVSRVLNGHPSVRPETRARVEAAIAQLGYRRNTVARALKSKRSSTIGVVMAGSGLYELPRVLLGIETTARAAGYEINLASWQGSAASDLAEMVRRLTDQSVEGVAVIAARQVAVDALSDVVTDVPMSVVMSGSVPNPRVGFVELDQELGARLAVRHLRDLGHERIVHLAGNAATFDATARVQGWRDELSSSPDLPQELLQGDFTAASGYSLTSDLARSPDGLPTAIFAGNDLMALGALAALAELGLSVPDDVSLVGFDDIAGADHFIPALTTVRQDFETLGSTAMETLLSTMSGQEPVRRQIPPTLVVRKSTAAPRRS